MIPTHIKQLGTVLESVRADGVMSDAASSFADDMAAALRECERTTTAAREAADAAHRAQRTAQEAIESAELARIALVRLFDPTSADAIERARGFDRKSFAPKE